MTFKDFGAMFLRELTLAVASFTALLCVAERLAPGSVLPYLNLYGWIFATLLLVFLSPPLPSRRRWTVIGLLPIIFLLVAFLFLITSEVGRWGLLLTGAAGALALAVLFALVYPGESNSDV